VVCALACILQKNPVASAIWLVGTMFALAGIYVLLEAPFLGAIQILVYAGAIMVLFLFVIMLLNLGRDDRDIRRWPAFLLAGALAVGIGSALAALGRYTPHRLGTEVAGVPQFGDPSLALPGGVAGLEAAGRQGVVAAVAEPLFQTYLVPFEVTSVLLLAAAVGAVVLAKRRI